MIAVKTSARRKACRRVAVAAVLAVMTAGAGACGNRLDEGRLQAAARQDNAGGQPAPGAASPAAGASSENPAPGGATGTTSAVAGSSGTSPAVATPAASPGGNASPAGAVPAPRTSSGAAHPATAAAARSNAGSISSGGGAGNNAASPSPNGPGGAKTVPGGGGVPGGSAPAAPGPGGTCSGTKAPIVIGSIGEYSGLLGPILAPGAKSVQAWVAATNAKGGLNCHPVKLVVYDTGGDPARNQALTQRAVEQDHAIAFVYNGAPLSGQASADYLHQRRIPVIGEEGAQPWVCYDPMGFPVMSSCDEGIEGIYQMLAKVVRAGDKVAAITCNEVPFCVAYHNLAEKYATEAGLKLVYNGTISMTQPDYTSACLEAKNAGAKMLVLGMENTSAARVRRSCKSVGLDVPIASTGTAFSAVKPGDGLDGVWEASGVRITPPSHPGVAEWLAAMKQFVPNTPVQPTGGMGWVA